MKSPAGRGDIARPAVVVDHWPLARVARVPGERRTVPVVCAARRRAAARTAWPRLPATQSGRPGEGSAGGGSKPTLLGPRQLVHARLPALREQRDGHARRRRPGRSPRRGRRSRRATHVRWVMKAGRAQDRRVEPGGAQVRLAAAVRVPEGQRRADRRAGRRELDDAPDAGGRGGIDHAHLVLGLARVVAASRGTHPRRRPARRGSSPGARSRWRGSARGRPGSGRTLARRRRARAARGRRANRPCPVAPVTRTRLIAPAPRCG